MWLVARRSCRSLLGLLLGSRSSRPRLSPHDCLVHGYRLFFGERCSLGNEVEVSGLRVQQMPNGKVAIVGYTDHEEVVNAEQLGAQRAVNIKYYLTTDELGPKVDPTRLEPRKGGSPIRTRS